jgi:hypothetical protein
MLWMSRLINVGLLRRVKLSPEPCAAFLVRTCAIRQMRHGAQVLTKTRENMYRRVPSAVLFHHAEREMGCSRYLKRLGAFQVDSAEVIEQASKT